MISPLCGVEGYATRAAKTLLSAGQEQRDMTLLCLHDADPYGYNIGGTLQEATEALPKSQHQRDPLGLGTTRSTRLRSGYRTVYPKEGPARRAGVQ